MTMNNTSSDEKFIKYYCYSGFDPPKAEN